LEKGTSGGERRGQWRVCDYDPSTLYACMKIELWNSLKLVKDGVGGAKKEK
jgi:hypothetical protein